MIVCENSGHSVEDDFVEVSKIVEAGATSKPTKDYELSRYAGDGGIEIRVQDQDVWLTQKAISQLLDVDRSVVTKHLKNISV